MTRTKNTPKKNAGAQGLRTRTVATAVRPSLERVSKVPPQPNLVFGKDQPQWLREIEVYQSRTILLLQQAPFSRLVREIMQKLHPDLRIQRVAVEALQVATEEYGVKVLELCNLLAIHARRCTVMKRDLELAMRILNNFV